MATKLIRTDDTMTLIEVAELFDYDADADEVPAVIEVCDGEWRRDPKSSRWRFWIDVEVA